MPANKFHGFYYGVGMKVDEASIDKAGQQLENKLNKVVDNVLKEVGTISTAVSKGMGKVDTTALVDALKEARGELDAFQDFDPNKLKNQVSKLETSLEGVSGTLGELTKQLHDFSEEVTTRLSNIEIKTSKQGKDALKSDLKDLIKEAKIFEAATKAGYSDTSVLDKYFKKVKDGFRSILNSENKLEIFSDKELGQLLERLTQIFHKTGEPINKFRDDLILMASEVGKALNDKGITGVFDSIEYKVERVSSQLNRAQAKLSKTDAEIASMSKRINTNLGNAFQVDANDKNLKTLDEKIQRIEQYSDVLENTEIENRDDSWLEMYKKRIALMQEVERQLKELSDSDRNKYTQNINDLFGMPQGDSYLNDWLEEYIEESQRQLEKLKALKEKTQIEIKKYKNTLSSLQTREAATATAKKDAKSTRNKKEKIDPNISAEVKVKPKIVENEWKKAINQAITNVEGKVKPFNIGVQASSRKINDALNKFKQQINGAWVKDKTDSSDEKNFTKRINNFSRVIIEKKQVVLDSLKEFTDEIRNALTFKFKIEGTDKKTLTDNIDKHLLSLVDVVNEKMEKKPIIFKSNIDLLIEEVKSKLENIEITSNVNINGGTVTGAASQVPSNVTYILGGLTQAASAATTSIQSLAGATEEGTKQEEKKTEGAKKRGRLKKDAEGGATKKRTPTQNKEKDELDSLPETRLTNGQKIIQYYIRLAKIAKELGPISEIADIPITADMFANGEIEKWIRGKKYTEKDVDTLAPGKHLTEGALNTFLKSMGITEADLAQANTKEEKDFLTPLKTYIFAFIQNRNQLNALLKELTDSQNNSKFIEAYNSADADKTSFLANGFTSYYKKLMSGTSKESDRNFVSNTFSKYGIDLSKLPTAKTYAEQWEIIQKELINKEGLDFDALISDLGSLKGNVGKVYQNFMTVLKVAKAYASTSDSLRVVGQEANAIISGRRDNVDKRVKYKNELTGLWEETGEFKTVNKVVEQGIRGMLRNLKVVFEDEMGRVLLGYGLGKGVIPDDKFVSGNSSYTKIIKLLTTALSEASKLMFDPKFQQGAQLERWKYGNSNGSVITDNTYKLTKSNVSQISDYIIGTDIQIKTNQSAIKKRQDQIQELQNKITELKKENTDADVSQYETEIDQYTKEIEQKQKRVRDLEAHLKDLNQQLVVARKKITYDKSYNQAVEDLPKAKALKEEAKLQLRATQLGYKNDYQGYLTNLIGQASSGQITIEKMNQLKNAIPDIEELNTQLQNGALKSEDYIKKVTDALVKMRGVSDEVGKTQASTDAKALLDANNLVIAYESEVKILEKIKRTQKPKEPPKTEPTSNTQPTTQPQQPSGTPTQVQGGTVTVPNGNIVLGSGIAVGGLATENTVCQIYKLLSIKKDGSKYDSQIEAIKKAIETKEAELNAKTQSTNQQKNNDNKKTNTAEGKKQEAEKKTQTSEEKKQTEEKKKQTSEEKKQTEEKKKQTSESKKQTNESKTQTSEEKKSTQEKKSQPKHNALDPIQRAEGKSVEELFRSFYQYNQEVRDSLRMFREHRFFINNGKASNITVGTHASVLSKGDKSATAGGHMHPKNSMYSATDLGSMGRRLLSNRNYNTDYLVTPNLVTKLSGLQTLKGKDLRDFIKIQDVFNLFEKIPYDNIEKLAKLSFLKEFSENKGLEFSTYSYDQNGKLQEITPEYFSKDVLQKIITLAEKKREFKETSKTDPKYQTLSDEIRKLAYELNSNKEYTKAKNEITPWTKEEYQKIMSIPAIQSALDQNFDISKFYNEIESLISKEAENIITKPIKDFFVSNKGKSISNINSILPNLKEYFGYSKGTLADGRFSKIWEEKGLSPKYDRPVKAENDNIKNQYDNLTIPELKAELARLEGLRDSGEVDPRFATAEKQDVIIEILKNGVAVTGVGKSKTSNGGAEDGKKDDKKRATIGQVTNTAQKEINVESGKASTTVKDTGDIITKTAQKCGAEILTITTSVKDGVKSTTASISNDYQAAMRETNAQIAHQQELGLFGKTYDPNISSGMTEAQQALADYQTQYQKLVDLISKFRNLDLTSTSGEEEAYKLQAEINTAQVKLDDLEEKLVRIADTTKKFLGGGEAFRVFDAGVLDNTGMSLKLLAQDTENAMVAFNGLYNDGTKLLYDVFDPATSTFKRYSLELDKATGYVKRMETAETGLVNAFKEVNKVQKQSANIEAIEGINQQSSLYKAYTDARKNLDDTVTKAWTTAKSENRLVSLDEQKEIYALSLDVERLGKRILSTANTFKNFRDQGGEVFDLLRNDGEGIESAMRRVARENALSNKSSIDKITYNDVTKKMTYELTDLYGQVTKVTMAYNEMFNAVQIKSENNVAAIAKTTQAIFDNSDAIQKSVDNGLLDTRTDAYKKYTAEYENLLKYIEELEVKDEQLTQAEIDNVNQRKDAVKSLGDELVKLAKKNETSMGYGSKKVQSQKNIRPNVDRLLEATPELANTDQYQKYIDSYQAMIDKQKEFRANGTLPGEEEQKKLTVLAKKTEDARVALEKLAKTSADLRSKAKSPDDIKPIDFNPNDQVAMEEAMRRFAQSTSSAAVENWNFKNAQDGATWSMKQGKNQIAEMTIRYDEGTKSLVRYTVQTKEVKTGWESFLDSLKGKWKEVARYLMTFGSIYRVWGVLKQGVTYVKEIDSALTELKKVTDETEETYDRFLNTAAKTADKVGSTIKEVVSSTADFARLGYALKDAAELAENAQILMNVSEFTDINTATDTLISAIQAFSYTADQSLHVVDIMNTIGE